jgi:hypothetical protein
VVATVEFEDAVLDRERGQVAGEGKVVFVSEEGRIEGRGFLFDERNSELTLKSEVVARLPMGRVVAGHAIVSLAPGGGESKSRVVKAAELTGGVVVTELRDKKAGTDKLEAQWARYRAEDGFLRLASSVDYWRGAERGRLDSETVEYVLGELKVPVGGKRE